ncbi:hypothetical protein LPB03_00900 [Polaribacter vadi]|jgi:hypothetical protein|uniref:Riboflavin synthase subunit beta n=1 Tax=Polaribacter vadi TaxID=1774273 RepID=A0A1B8U128_9FLAO|nr:hypothetical protein [Polaribacter vadi]AOW16103.1 hypothetical protein LPB03_00900 [Polaribacter vadi]OBY65571.1 hypothetical protein LPB3_04210 [Polaribacter vadi]|tara:strand:+ start:269 stop:565 length:297 start_codon:yes stop_codon:yes gene_type:complete
MFGNAFKTRSYNVFDYKPRYYNERKERIRKLEESYAKNRALGKDENLSRVDFSPNNLRKAWKRSKSPISNRKSSLRLAAIIAILVGIAAYILDFHSLF